MVDMKMGAEHVVDLLEADAEREQLVAPALLAGKIERRRMALVLAGAGVDQDDVMRRAHHEGLVGDDDHAECRVEHLRLHRGQMMLEDGLVIGRKEVLRPPPRAFALDHRIDGDIADPDLPHPCISRDCWEKRNGRLPAVQADHGGSGPRPEMSKARRAATTPVWSAPRTTRTRRWGPCLGLIPARQHLETL